MQQTNPCSELITDMSVHDYFDESLNNAIANQQKELKPETTFYIINLLTTYNDSNRMFVKENARMDLKPLAFIYADAVNSESRGKKISYLKYLGDVALFISGLFSYSLNRSLVDVDYYIGMGESAYGSLGDFPTTSNHSGLRLIYTELAFKFSAVVELLNEVADQMQSSHDTDVMRLYEIWMRTGSQYSADRLRRLGIEPIESMRSGH